MKQVFNEFSMDGKQEKVVNRNGNWDNIVGCLIYDKTAVQARLGLFVTRQMAEEGRSITVASAMTAPKGFLKVTDCVSVRELAFSAFQLAHVAGFFVKCLFMHVGILDFEILYRSSMGGA